MFHRHPFLSLATFAYLGFLTWATLTPQASSFNDSAVLRLLGELHERGYALQWDYSDLEFLANIALFVPVGVFLLLLFGAGGWMFAGFAAFALTVAIEVAQREIPGRVSDPRDVVANTMGGMIGVVVALVLTMPATIRRVRLRRAERFA